MNKILILTIILSSTVLFNISCSLIAKDEVKISFTGDIIMHNPIKRSAYKRNKIDNVTKKSLNNRGFDYFFEKINPYLKSSHVVLGNMEFPIHPPFKSGNMIFNCYPEILPALKKAGFTMLSFANNHTLDQGRMGVISSLKYLKKYKFDYIGVDNNETSARRGLVINKKGIKIGFIAYTGVTNYPIPRRQRGYFINWFYKTKKVRADIRAIKKRCDYLIMYVHTGEEYKFYPERKDKRYMKKYINMGVDLIIGHHPHVLQPIERVKAKDGRECLIFYSLGNFISNQTYHTMKVRRTDDTAIVSLYLSKDLKSKKLKSRFEILSVWTLNNYSRKEKLKTVQPLPIDNEIMALKEKIKKNETDKKNIKKKETKEIKSIKRKIRFLKRKGNFIKKILLRWIKKL
ncbi:CapA family protein [Spirochaetota bacterium]